MSTPKLDTKDRIAALGAASATHDLHTRNDCRVRLFVGALLMASLLPVSVAIGSESESRETAVTASHSIPALEPPAAQERPRSRTLSDRLIPTRPDRESVEQSNGSNVEAADRFDLSDIDEAAFELTGPAYFAPGDLRSIARKVLAVTFMIVPVCLLIIVFANRKRSASTPTGEKMTVVESLALGNRSQCDLLSVRGQLFLIARDASGIQGLQQVNPFNESLERFVAGSEFEENREESPAPTPSFRPVWLEREPLTTRDLGGQTLG